MKRIILVISALASLCFISCAQGKKNENDYNNKNMVLVAYFSATGTTEGVAKKIAAATDGDILEIKPEVGYSSDDLDWTDNSSRSSRESANRQSRPGIVLETNDVSSYEVIFLGYPVWWDEAPRVINTFIETFGLEGKKVIPFATSGGSGIANSVNVLRKSYPSVNWQSGKLLNRASSASVKEWTESLGL